VLYVDAFMSKMDVPYPNQIDVLMRGWWQCWAPVHLCMWNCGLSPFFGM